MPPSEMSEVIVAKYSTTARQCFGADCEIHVATEQRRNAGKCRA